MACDALKELSTQLGCIPRDPAGFSSKMYTVGLSLIGGVSIVFLIIGGYYILMSQGNPAILHKGKSYIFYAIAGLLLAIFGYIFLQVILVDILHLPGFS